VIVVVEFEMLAVEVLFVVAVEEFVLSVEVDAIDVVVVTELNELFAGKLNCGEIVWLELLNGL
jgi:hypothetical protein